jgi:hypothetical protein
MNSPSLSSEGRSRLVVVVHADVERSLPGDLDLLHDVMMASRKNATIDWRLSYVGHAFCNSL